MKGQVVSSTTWTSRLYTGAWVLYAGYYICRMDLGSVPGSAVTHLAAELACFGVAYAIAQFVGGELADRFDPRRVALAGAALSVICTASLAFFTAPQMILLLQFGNGFGQGFGWPALLKLFGRWFGAGQRDRTLGWWSTSYILGGFVASSLTMWLTVHLRPAEHGSVQPAYLIVSAVLLLAGVFFYLETRVAPGQQQDAETRLPAAVDSQGWRGVAGNRRIRYIAAMYFFLKTTRYTLLFWLPRYLVSSSGYTSWSAAHIASCFELFGIAGPIAVGYVVERRLAGRQLQLGAVMLYALAFLCLLHPLLAMSGTLGMVVSVSLMGMLIHGLDLLISGMAVLDAVPASLHGRAIGFVNGIGSFGQAVSPLLATHFVAHYGWSRLFDLFVFFAILSGIICTLGARSETGSGPPMRRSTLELHDIHP